MSADCKFLLSGGIYIFLRAGAPDVPYSLLSAPIVNTIEWKCFRFQYFIRGNNWYKASLMVLLKTLKSNLTTLLFFANEVTSEAQYTQIPLPSDDTNVQVFTKNRSSCNYTCTCECNMALQERMIRENPSPKHGPLPMIIFLILF